MTADYRCLSDRPREAAGGRRSSLANAVSLRLGQTQWIALANLHPLCLRTVVSPPACPHAYAYYGCPSRVENDRPRIAAIRCTTQEPRGTPPQRLPRDAPTRVRTSGRRARVYVPSASVKTCAVLAASQRPTATPAHAGRACIAGFHVHLASGQSPFRALPFTHDCCKCVYTRCASSQHCACSTSRRAVAPQACRCTVRISFAPLSMRQQHRRARARAPASARAPALPPTL